MFDFKYPEAADATAQNIQNLLKKVTFSEGCWLWTAKSKARFGYGLIRAGKKQWYAHRLVYTMTYGPIPPMLIVMHTCDNPGCLRPDHLRLGTVNDNVQDRVAKERSAYGMRNGMHSKPESRAFGIRNGSRTRPEARPRGLNHAWHTKGIRPFEQRKCLPEEYARGDRNGSKTKPASRPRGERNTKAKLTTNQVLAIRQAAKEGQTSRQLAACYGVVTRTIYEIIYRKTWTHLKDHMTTTLPTLYKRNSNATAIQQWTISVTDATITTVYGQVGGAMQTTNDTVTQGKNLGKKNATTPEQQAMLEAEAQHERKRKAGYVASLEQAQKGGLDELIEGGVVPMLAKVYSDRADKVVFPVAVQPKLDGHRCVAVIVVDETVLGRRATVTLWTRTRKRIKSLPHIEKQLSEIFCKWEIGTYHLDGENYQHDYRDRFEELTSLIRPDEPRPGHEIVEYHIYDIVSPETFLNRFKTLEHVFDTTTHLKLVETHVAADEAALLSHYDYFKKQGYEGAMCRTLDTPYEHKRSSSLLKMKDFVDGEFRVVRLEEGRGKLQRHVGAFVCVTEDGVEFGAKGAMPNETLRQAWLEPEKWVGKMMTVKYFGKTADGSLRFPSALRLREEVA